MQDLTTNPDWHLQRIDLIRQQALMLRLDRAAYQSASFLDERLEPQIKEGYWLDFDQLLSHFPDSAPDPDSMAYIFHIGHCGSTLLSRIYDQPEASLVIREPLSLRFLADSLRRIRRPDSWLDQTGWDNWQQRIIQILGRRYHGQQQPLIKASSTCNNLIQSLLGAAKDHRAVLMYLPLKSYLMIMLKGQRNDIRGFAGQRLQDILRIAPDSGLSLSRLEDWQLVVIGWLASMQDILAASAAFPEAIRLLDFEHLLANPQDHIHPLKDHLRLAIDGDEIDASFQTSVRQYSKQPDLAYSPEQRQRAMADSSRQNAALISRAMDWAGQLIAAHSALQGPAEFLE